MDQQSIEAIIIRAAQAAGIDPRVLLAIAGREGVDTRGNLDPRAKNGDSSATGLFQFIDSTWLSMMRAHAAQYGINIIGMSDAEILALRNDPLISAQMAAESIKENTQLMSRSVADGGLGRTPIADELYLAHFMGPADAVRLIKAAEAG